MATLPLLKAEDGRRPWCPQRGQLGDGGRRVWNFVQGGVDCLPRTCRRTGLSLPVPSPKGLAIQEAAWKLPGVEGSRAVV